MSPIYCDNRIILSHPKVRSFVCSNLSKQIKKTFPEIEIIAGVATGAIGIAALVAQDLGLPMVYVRAASKGHGRKNLIEGHLESEKKVVVIEDLISTGNSSLMAINALRSEDLIVKGMISIFTYGFDISYENFKDKNVDFHSLSSYDYLLEQALDINYITDNEFKILKDWKKNPAQWEI